MHPLPEYPRPSMRRDSYVNLNGPWDYAITQSSEFPAKWDGAILVPYSPEAKASGVGRPLQPGPWLPYPRPFTPPAGAGGRGLPAPVRCRAPGRAKRLGDATPGTGCGTLCSK